MYSEGHWGIGMLLYAPIVALLSLILPDVTTYALLGVVVVAFTCSLPDIDMRLKNFTPIKHRGITHTVWFALFTGLLIGAFAFTTGYYLLVIHLPITSTNTIVFHSVFAGIIGVYGTLSHFVGDIITPTGLRPFKPVKDTRYRFVMTILGQESKAANQYWNKALHITGTVTIVLTLVVSIDPVRNALLKLI